MSGLINRLRKLERDAGPMAHPMLAIKRWHTFIQSIGQSEKQARADYERDNSKIGPKDGVIVHRIVDAVKRPPR